MKLNFWIQAINCYHDFIRNDTHDCRNDFDGSPGEVEDPMGVDRADRNNSIPPDLTKSIAAKKTTVPFERGEGIVDGRNITDIFGNAPTTDDPYKRPEYPYEQ